MRKHLVRHQVIDRLPVQSRFGDAQSVIDIYGKHSDFFTDRTISEVRIYLYLLSQGGALCAYPELLTAESLRLSLVTLSFLLTQFYILNERSVPFRF